MQSRKSWVDLRGFAAVDDAADQAPLIRALEVGKASPAMREVGAAVTKQLQLAHACAVLDLGCGLGSDALAMAAELPAGGRVVGVDASHTMVTEATARAAGSGAPVLFTVGSALAVPFPDQTFDRCRAQALLQHIPNPPGVIDEVYRILRPGGRVAAFEFDLGTTVLDHPNRSTTRTILDFVTDSALQGWVGRQLPRLYREAGFVDITAVPYPVPNDYDLFMFTMRRPLAQLVQDRVLDARSVVRWLRELEELHNAGHYLGGSVGYLLTATKN
ncbi:methyltransferase domain-containing protein [Streptomyces sp. ICN988]|uniref:methyltransferase domain-containing protein n=1 Tax=Streptomyces sp. ICN988 TaxID=2983765 RepID=UPI0021E481D6|nr:methyltransferase domain-containing protein [Streptomyces sp. ICN988]MCV2458426.1 methyltransferase domain-containing protein [Streptomyces sp. ICN988]